MELLIKSDEQFKFVFEMVGGKLPQNPPPSDPYNIDVILKGKFKI